MLWLEFLGLPFMVYMDGQGLIGAILPALFGFFIITHDWKTITHQSKLFYKLVGVGVVLCVTVGIGTGYWTTLGYHYLDAGLLFWPVVALIDDDFRPWWAYPLTFFPSLSVDVLGAGQHAGWAGNYWFGVGGAGFHDGLFIGPLTTLICALCCSLLGKYLQFQGYLYRESV